MTEYESLRNQYQAGLRARQDAAPFLMEVLKTGFNVERLRADYQQILGSYALRAKPEQQGSKLGSLSFTYRPGAKEPLYDGNQSQFNPKTGERKFRESEFSEFNPAFRNTEFYEIYEAMPFKVGRMRVNMMPPSIVLGVHRDTSPRAHIALVTNPDCFITSGDGQAYHVPPDGNVYMFDTRLPHSAFNASREDRLQLVIAMADHEI